MIKIMAGTTTSKRNTLFLNRKEREGCSGDEVSRLYQLSNPGFLGGGSETDTAVIKRIISEVLYPNIHLARPDLSEVLANKPKETAFAYASCVLFQNLSSSSNKCRARPDRRPSFPS